MCVGVCVCVFMCVCVCVGECIFGCVLGFVQTLVNTVCFIRCQILESSLCHFFLDMITRSLLIRYDLRVQFMKLSQIFGKAYVYPYTRAWSFLIVT